MHDNKIRRHIVGEVHFDIEKIISIFFNYLFTKNDGSLEHHYWCENWLHNYSFITHTYLYSKFHIDVVLFVCIASRPSDQYYK